MAAPPSALVGRWIARRSAVRHAAQSLILAACVAGAAGRAGGQVIPIRTVPVAQAHQFEIFPSHAFAMGGVSIALADSLLDPFVNPAKATRLARSRFFGSPALYSVTREAGGGRALPLGVLTKAGPWYGGVLLALQQVDLSRRNGLAPFPPFPACPGCRDVGLDLTRDDRSHGNSYAFASAARELPSRGLALGGSVLWAGLNAIDGVDLLYAGSARIKQRGQAVDLRVGVLKEMEGEGSLEALVLHNRFAMTHDVLYLDGFWDPGGQQFAQRPRLERNLDHTDTWGLHLAYQRPLSADGWRIGGLGTVNYKTHPKIPNYEIMNIPRDPGHSTALNAGLGLARTRGTSTLGMDLVYEPIWSYTWADAETALETRPGGSIPPGGKTIENRFRFSNAQLRLGVADELEFDGPDAVVGLQLGLMVHTIRYRLAQQDNVEATRRTQRESWVEWTPTWGVAVRRPVVEIAYRGRVTHGTGRPGVAGPGGGCLGFCVARLDAVGSSIVVAPSGPLTLDPVSVFTHQISVAFPLH